MKLTTQESDKNKRLDRFLVLNFPEKSRSYWQKETKIGKVLVDGKTVTPHHFLKGNEKIEIATAKPIKIKQKIPKLNIIAETKDYIIINKPSGLLVHKTETSDEPTLVDAIIAHDPDIAKIGETDRPGIAHRLDRDVSGIMIIAKTEKMFEYLKNQFTNRQIHKEYIALVHGELPKDLGEITFKIGRKTTNGRMAARPSREEGREARTTYEVIKRFPNMTLIKVKPETGRTHQIRAHFFALGYPIVGDQLYKSRKKKIKETEPTRIMLHSTKLSFIDLDNKTQTYEAPLPEKFNEFIK